MFIWHAIRTEVEENSREFLPDSALVEAATDSLRLEFRIDALTFKIFCHPSIPIFGLRLHYAQNQFLVAVSDQLIDIHVKLLRKILSGANKVRFDKHLARVSSVIIGSATNQ